MTPRAIAGSNYNADFRRQLAERNGEQDHVSKKKLRGAAAPKGSKLAAGYTDRAAGRGVQAGEDEKAARIKALEEQMKLGQLEPEEFEKLRDQITEGDIGSTHLVKGLDRQLLERIRRGEDVLSEAASKALVVEKGEDKEEDKMAEEDVEDAFATLEEKEIAPVIHEAVVKKGEMAPPPPVAGVKRSRNDILAELKASRKAAQEEAEAKAAEQQLGSRFRKIGDRKTSKEPRIEIDERGREVLITYDEYGRIKRKVKKVESTTTDQKSKHVPMRQDLNSKKAVSALLMPDKDAKPLGMEAPAGLVVPTPPVNDDADDDIFAGAGVAYNPLGDVQLDDSDSDSDAEDTKPVADTEPSSAKLRASPTVSSSEGELADEEQEENAVLQEPLPTAIAPPVSHTQKQNYFKDEASTTAPRVAPSQDPILLGAMKRAAAIASAAEEKEAAIQSTAAQRLMARDRDLDDLDMGFGSSRFGDEEDEEGGGKIKLSEWRGGGAGDEDDDGDKKRGGGKGPRKRGNKKRKGDANNAEDVLRVMEKRKQIG